MAYDEGLAERLRLALSERKGLTEKRMFGGLAFMLHGNMCCGIVESELMLRVGPENYGVILAKPHARQMDFTGRPMKGFVFISEEGYEEDVQLKQWLDIALTFVASLPPK
ncbi:MAG: TfoX/Sxy family protein [Gammaproteobacteria bacterium]|nr:TfoX/Sxy family protein [Gammaproteobacteria bacterium]